MANIDDIHKELLDQVDDSYQKSQGFPTWDILRAMAFGLYQLWCKALDIEAKQDVDNLTGDELTRFVAQRKGTDRKPANKAVGELTVLEGTGTITIGDLFESEGGIQFQATETKAVTVGDTFSIEAVIASESGNLPADTITLMPKTIQGISKVTNATETIDGYDTESDDDLRTRYYEAIREPATSGNVYHYKRWAKEVPGVGDARVVSLWNGDNTVKVVIIDSDRKPANTELVERVQEYIDPNKAGTGEGQAPVGAYCTVVSANALTVNVACKVVLTVGYDISDVKTSIEQTLAEYFAAIAYQEEYVSYAQIGSKIIELDGVADYSLLKINNTQGNLDISNDSVAVLGSVSLNV